LNISIDDLLRIVGEQEVTIRLLRAELARAQAALLPQIDAPPKD